jgi:hypothetical protein
MTGASDVTLLESTATLTLDVWREGKEVRVMTVVTNDRAGHHIPTDHPARNILLVVSATGLDGKPLAMRWGDLVPPWGGTGDAAEDYAGRPGRGYAKILEEKWTEVAPTAAYWNPTVLREDTRIAALASDVANWGFQESSIGGPVKVTARLIFRRAFRSLQKQKGWDTPDILMNETTVTAP